jgi:hypothetical protein
VSRRRGSASADADVLHGVYERLCAATYWGVDPRIYVSSENEVPTLQAAKVVNSPLIRLLDANQPVVVAKWRISGNSNPGARQQFPWLAGPGCVRVWPDDRIEPTDDEADPC